VQIAETFKLMRNLGITASASSNRLFFYDLVIIFVRGKADHHY